MTKYGKITVLTADDEKPDCLKCDRCTYDDFACANCGTDGRYYQRTADLQNQIDKNFNKIMIGRV